MKELSKTIACCLFLAAFPALAADGFPNRPVRWIIPAPPGGGTDAVARIVAPKLVEMWKYPVVIDNRGGAQGSLGTALAAKSPPDGHTIVFAYSGPIVVNPHIYREVGYDALRDFAALTRLTQQPMIMTAHPSLPVASLKELAAHARQNPGKITFASSASLQHLAGELFKLSAGVDLLHVPYKGAGPAVLDLLGGNVNTMISNPTSVVPHVKSGRLRAIGIIGAHRIDALRDVPTAAEAGFPEFANVIEWYGVLAPAATPRPVIDALNDAFVRALRMPDVQQRIQDLGMTPSTSTPAEYDKQIRADYALWGKVAKTAGVKAE